MKRLILIVPLLLFAGIVFGQTLHKGGIISFRTYTIVLQPGVTMDQYQVFLTAKYIPAIEKNFPGIKIFVLEGHNGVNPNQIAEMWYFDSVEAKDRYAYSRDKDSELYAKIEPLIKEFSKYRVSYDVQSTNWVIK